MRAAQEILAMSYYPQFAEILNQALTRLDRPPSWLAQRLEVNQSTVSRWLNHGVRPGDPETVARIADILGMAGQVQDLLVATGYGYVERQDSVGAGLDTAQDSEQIHDAVTPGKRSPDPNGQPQAASAPPHNLPTQLTPFIGRKQELVQIAGLLAKPDCRLLSIIGPGGIGKTRLALHVATQLVDDTPHGVFFMPLAQLSDPDNIVPTIAAALSLQLPTDGQSMREQLFAYLRNRQMVLVLDNFEHLLEGITLVQDLLQVCPTIRLLVTSRERLNLTSETVYTLGSLDFPSWEVPQQILAYDAIQLFVQTVQRTRPDEELDADDMRYIARICRLVGGMPLGIILAASWIEVLSPEEIAAELTQGINLLAANLHDLPERQRSMDAVIAYSWRRLSPEERGVFMRLSLFRGGFTREAAQAVAGASLPHLARLVGTSFVQRVAGSRYDMHELLRQYAEQQLQKADEYTHTKKRHGDYYLALLHKSAPAMAGPDQLKTIRTIESDFENIRVAWLWAVETNAYTAANRALEGLFRWTWLWRNRRPETLELLRAAQEAWRPHPGQLPQPVWGRILARILDQQATWLDEPLDARIRIEQAMAIAHRTDDQAEIAFCTWVLAFTIVSERQNLLTIRELPPALTLYEQSIELYRQHQDGFWLGVAFEHLGHCHRLMEQYDRAVTVLQESLDIRRAMGDSFGAARSLRELGFAALRQGKYDETLDAWQAALHLHRQSGDEHGITDIRFFSALLYLSRGEHPRARQLLEQVMQYSVDMHNATFQRWSSRGLIIATAMQESATPAMAGSTLYPNVPGAFAVGIMWLLYARFDKTHRLQLSRLLELATTEIERAVCMPFAAGVLAQRGGHTRAVMLLALAHRYPAIAEGWIVHLPEIVALEMKLRNVLPPAEFARVWVKGQTLDLLDTAAAVQVDLADLVGAENSERSWG